MKFWKDLDNKFEESILVVLLVLMACIMIVQVFCRYVLHNSLGWSEELTRFLFIWSTFLSISYCIRQKLSIAITLISDAFKGRMHIFILVFIDLAQLVLYAYMTAFAWRYLMQTISNHQVSTALQLPMAFINAAPLVGFVLSVIRSIQMTVIDLEAKPEKTEDPTLL